MTHIYKHTQFLTGNNSYIINDYGHILKSRRHIFFDELFNTIIDTISNNKIIYSKYKIFIPLPNNHILKLNYHHTNDLYFINHYTLINNNYIIIDIELNRFNDIKLLLEYIEEHVSPDDLFTIYDHLTHIKEECNDNDI